MQDVERTFPDNLYFRNDSVKETMLEILFIWCREHTELSYRQGMHELVAPILFHVYSEYTDKNVIPDVYAIFSKLMERMKPIYDNNPVSTRASICPTNVAELTLFNENNVSPPLRSDSYLMATCRTIQDDYLKTMDNTLWQHLNHYRIEPQLYGM